MQRISAFGTIALLIAFGPQSSTAQKSPSVQSKEEAFRVSMVGRSNDPQARVKLKEFFDTITSDYNRISASEFAKKQKSFEGQKLKILDNLKKKDSHGNLYLAAYQGEFAVISLPGELRKKGQLTPPLEL
ncbi:MAG: hypothetical protein AAF191_09685, partial [Verrucomicrobiota bacterium]